MTKAHASRVRRSGSFSLGAAPCDAFRLFTAEGEREWVPGWEPTLLGPAHEPGLVFLTGAGREATIWTVLEHDPRTFKHRYSRVTPALRAGTVEVCLYREGRGCRVDLTYELTALPGAGDDALAGYSEAKFEAMLREWRDLLSAHLQRQAEFA